MEAAVAGSLSVVVFPWLAFGHMIPYLELSKPLAARGLAITFVSTPRNLARLPPVPGELSARVRFVSLPLPAVDGLPDDAESTADVPPEKIELVKKALTGLAQPLAAFLAEAVAGGRKPDWIIHDFCHHWLAPVAGEHKVPCAMLQTTKVAMPAFLGPRWAHARYPRTAPGDFTVPPKWMPFPCTMTYRRYEANWVAGAFQPDSSGMSDMERCWQTSEGCRLIIHRSCHEVEPRLFDLATDLFQKPVVPAGLLLPPSDTSGPNGAASRSEILRWLDDQPGKSVIYVALGSEAPLTAKNLHELALGLELAGARFLWALRKPAGMFSSDASGGVLPDGFEERTCDRGLVWMGWVPQVEVLAHGAVAAFLTHCGWGSIIESLLFGHPLVMLPFIVDQGLNSREMAAKGIGVEVTRDETDGSFDRDGVAAAVRRVMVEDEGKMITSNTMKLKEAVTDEGRQERYIDELVDLLRRYKDA